VRALVSLAAVLAVVVGAAPTVATAELPCWKQAVDDWFDGQFDEQWPCDCLREAARNADVEGAAYGGSSYDAFARAVEAACPTSAAASSPVFVERAGSTLSARTAAAAAVAALVLVAGGVVLSRRRTAA
jgi:hypothetical protein